MASRAATVCIGLWCGIIGGGFLGWLAGLAIYYLVEVPKAAHMDKMMADSYLCGAGMALPFLAVPGAVIGAFVGLCGSLYLATSGETKEEV